MTMEQMKVLAKRHGAVSFAKVILSDTEKYAKALSEAEFVDLMMEEARTYQKTGESNRQAFSRMFSADSPEALLLRQAHAAVKQAHFPPVGTESVSKGVSAYDQLVARGKTLCSSEPGLTLAQAFNKVFMDPVNANLANPERRENRPTPTSYPPGGER